MAGLLDLLRDIAAEWRRLLLVTAGVAWGTASLAFLVAFTGGMDVAMTAALEVAGPRLLVLSGGATTMPHRGLPAGRWNPIRHGDAERIAPLPGVAAVSREYSRPGTRIAHGGVAVNMRLLGVDPSFGAMRWFQPQPGGRFLHDRDLAERRRVVFLGDGVKARLFGDADCIGARVTILGQPFTVVGVRAPAVPLGNYDGEDHDKMLIPASTYRALLAPSGLSRLVVGLHDAEDEQAVRAAILRALGARHGFDPRDRAAVEVRSGPAQTRQVRGILDGMSLFTLVVGVLSLAVAALGVANAAYAMVEERSAELGVALAVGARPRTIAARQLLEAMLVVLAGGVLGLAGTAALLWGVGQLPMDDRARAYLGEPALSVGLALLITLALGLCGALAGWMPARRAAALQPVEVLRDA